MNTAAERMKMIRETFSLNRTRLAEILGVSSSLISLMELGKANVSRKMTGLLEEKLGISPVWVSFGLGEMFSRSDVFVDAILNKLQKVTGINPRIMDRSAITGADVTRWLQTIDRREQLKNEAPDRLMRIRNGFGLTQSDLARRIGYTRAYISAVEKGIQRPSLRMAEMIEKEFGISATWLLYGVADSANCA